MDDFGLYDDLDEFHENEEKKSKELLALEEKYEAALKTIDAINMEKNDLRKKIRIMQQNLQSLLDTAKAEINRKDKMIESLRKEKDDICFRRIRVPDATKVLPATTANTLADCDRNDYKATRSKDTPKEISQGNAFANSNIGKICADEMLRASSSEQSSGRSSRKSESSRRSFNTHSEQQSERKSRDRHRDTYKDKAKSLARERSSSSKHDSKRHTSRRRDDIESTKRHHHEEYSAHRKQKYERSHRSKSRDRHGKSNRYKSREKEEKDCSKSNKSQSRYDSSDRRKRPHVSYSDEDRAKKRTRLEESHDEHLKKTKRHHSKSNEKPLNTLLLETIASSDDDWETESRELEDAERSSAERKVNLKEGAIESAVIQQETRALVENEQESPKIQENKDHSKNTSSSSSHQKKEEMGKIDSSEIINEKLCEVDLEGIEKRLFPKVTEEDVCSKEAENACKDLLITDEELLRAESILYESNQDSKKFKQKNELDICKDFIISTTKKLSSQKPTITFKGIQSTEMMGYPSEPVKVPETDKNLRLKELKNACETTDKILNSKESQGAEIAEHELHQIDLVSGEAIAQSAKINLSANEPNNACDDLRMLEKQDNACEEVSKRGVVEINENRLLSEETDNAVHKIAEVTEILNTAEKVQVLITEKEINLKDSENNGKESKVIETITKEECSKDTGSEVVEVAETSLKVDSSDAVYSGKNEAREYPKIPTKNILTDAPENAGEVDILFENVDEAPALNKTDKIEIKRIEEELEAGEIGSTNATNCNIFKRNCILNVDEDLTKSKIAKISFLDKAKITETSAETAVVGGIKIKPSKSTSSSISTNVKEIAKLVVEVDQTLCQSPEHELQTVSLVYTSEDDETSTSNLKKNEAVVIEKDETLKNTAETALDGKCIASQEDTKKVQDLKEVTSEALKLSSKPLTTKPENLGNQCNVKEQDDLTAPIPTAIEPANENDYSWINLTLSSDDDDDDENLAELQRKFQLQQQKQKIEILENVSLRELLKAKREYEEELNVVIAVKETNDELQLAENIAVKEAEKTDVLISSAVSTLSASDNDDQKTIAELQRNCQLQQQKQNIQILENVRLPVLFKSSKKSPQSGNEQESKEKAGLISTTSSKGDSVELQLAGKLSSQASNPSVISSVTSSDEDDHENLAKLQERCKLQQQNQKMQTTEKTVEKTTNEGNVINKSRQHEVAKGEILKNVNSNEISAKNAATIDEPVKVANEDCDKEKLSIETAANSENGKAPRKKPHVAVGNKKTAIKIEKKINASQKMCSKEKINTSDEANEKDVNKNYKKAKAESARFSKSISNSKTSKQISPMKTRSKDLVNLKVNKHNESEERRRLTEQHGNVPAISDKNKQQVLKAGILSENKQQLNTNSHSSSLSSSPEIENKETQTAKNISMNNLRIRIPRTSLKRSIESLESTCTASTETPVAHAPMPDASLLNNDTSLRLSTSAELRAMLIDGMSPEINNDILTTSSLSAVQETNIDELDRKMQAIFNSPAKFEVDSEPCGNSTIVDATIEESNISSSSILGDNLNKTSDSSFESKRFSLGKTQYVWERVSENEVNLFITRRRGKKRAREDSTAKTAQNVV